MSRAEVDRAGRPAVSRNRLMNDGAAAVAALLVYLFTSGGLFYYGQPVQLPVVVGLAAGLLASTLPAAAMAGSAAFVLGALALPPSMFAAQPAVTPQRIMMILGMALLSAVAAVVFGWLARRLVRGLGPLGGNLVLYAGILLLVVNLWATAWTVVNTSFSGRAPLVDRLEAPVQPGTLMSDERVYVLAQQYMDQGMGFYQAYAKAHSANSGFLNSPPKSLFGFRPPIVFYLRSLLPGRPMVRIVLGLLVVASLAILSASLAVREAVRAPAALVASAALASYFLDWASFEHVAQIDPWAACFGLAGFSLVLYAMRGERRRWLYGLGVALIALAVASRELMAFLVIAGLVSVALTRQDRRFRLTVWGVACAVIASALGLHYWFASQWIAGPAEGVGYWLNGSVTKLLLALQYAMRFLAPRGWLNVAIVLLSFAGIGYLVVRRRAEGLFPAIAVALPLIGFMFFANPARDDAGVAKNYWGVIVMPLILALVPLVFAWVPGVGRSSAARDSR